MTDRTIIYAEKPTTRIDHEPVVVHDLKGFHLHTVESVSIRGRRRPPEGYRYHHGWVDRVGGRWSLYTKLVY